MENNHHPHDKYFKHVFSIQQVVKDAIEQIFPKEVSKHIDTDSLQLTSTSHVNKKLKEYFSDLIYNCLWKGEIESELCLIFEHKSYAPEYPFIQLNQYFLDAVRQQIKQKQQLKPIIMVLFYHGNKTWNSKSFAEYFGKIDKELCKFIPKFEYILIDLSNFSDEQILALRVGFLINTLIVLKHKNDEKYLKKFHERIFIYYEKYFETEEGKNFLEVTFVYLIKAVGLEEEEVIEIIEILPLKIKTMARSAYQNILEKGIEKGININIRKMVQKTIFQFPKWSNKQIADFCETSENTVKEIREEMKK